MEIHIEGRAIGPEHEPYVIAELSGNHNGSLEQAMKIIEAAKGAGADAIKLQTYTADTMTIECDAPDFFLKEGPWAGRTLYDLYEEAQTPWEWHPTLFEKARELGLSVFSTPFDGSAVDFLEGLDVPAYKIASFELVDLALIQRVAATGKPTILSTGMAELSEIEAAVEAFRVAGGRELCLLHCTSGYPTPYEEANLRTIPDLARRFDVVCGLSDHTLGTAVPVAAVALGACVVEKHFTLRRADGGPDAAFSLEPTELKQLVGDVDHAWRALGSVSYGPQASERTQLAARRSLYVVADIRAGERFTEENVRAIRPGYGLPPARLSEVLQCRATDDIPRGTALREEMLSPR